MKQESLAAKIDEENQKEGIHKTNQILITEDIQKFDELFKKVKDHRELVEKIEEKRNKETENSSDLNSSIADLEVVKENESKVPNTPIAGDVKGVPEFKEIKARKSHSIRLNSNSQSQKS